jgi:hypothetical protein
MTDQPAQAPVRYVGGSFAPPLDPGKLIAYRKLAGGAEPRVQHALNELCDMVEAFHKHPRSKRQGTPHPSGVGLMVPLEKEVAAAIDAHVPWADECESLKQVFGAIDPVGQKELRDAAHHLLWYAIELERGRQPMTSDQL